MRGDYLSAYVAMCFQIASFFDLIPSVYHPTHERVGTKFLLPRGVPFSKILELRFVGLKNERDCSRGLNRGLDRNPKCIGIKVSSFRSMPLLVEIA